MQQPRKRRGYSGAMRLGALAGVILLALMQPACAQDAEQYSEDEVKAVYLYRFTSYIEWPPSPSAEGVFAIAVLGADGVADALSSLLSGHSIQGKPAVVYRIHRSRDIGDACMVYVGTDASDQLAATAAAVSGRPVLVVASEPAGLAHGETINFVPIDRHVRFEVSLTAASHAGLRISSELLSVATRVIGVGSSAIDQPPGDRLAAAARWMRWYPG